ncbi:MAG: hypothetical protein ACFFD1_01225 [Candidatus Thorarchaeota archaeon]
MRDIQSAISFIENNGNDFEKARLASIVNDSQPSQEIINKFAILQNKDGGFPYKNIQGSLTTINNSLFVLSWLDDLNLLQTPIARKLFQFLFEKEKNDGTWIEDSNILEYGPPSWMDPRHDETKIYDTVYTLFWLLKLNLIPNGKFSFYTENLTQYINRNGSFEGSLQNTWIGVSCLAMLNSWESAPVQRPLEYISSYPTTQYTVSELAWLLLTFLLAKYPPKNRLTAILSTNLFERQSSSGAFESEEGRMFDVETTLQALRIAKILKLL